MPIYHLVEYNDNYLKTCETLYQFYRDDQKNPITDFQLFKFKASILGNTKVL